VGIFVKLLISFQFEQFLRNCLQVMDLQAQTKFAPTITFSGKIGNGPSFSEFQVRLIVVLREKHLHQATKNADNIYRSIPLNSTQAITKEAYSKDR
jgi:hypothetical protein